MLKDNYAINNFVKIQIQEIASLVYEIIRGELKEEELRSEKERILYSYVNNECTEEGGECYELYNTIKRLKEDLIKSCEERKLNELTLAYEDICGLIAQKMFLYGMKIGNSLLNFV